MKTIGIKLNDIDAEKFQIAAIHRGLTVSAAIAAILRQATNDFQDFSVLNGVTQPKRGRASKPRASEELAECFANGETIADLLKRFDHPRRRRA